MKHSNLFFCMLFMSMVTNAQINMSYSIGCVGNTNQKMPVFTSAVMINGKGCFSLANGVRLYEATKQGIFTTGCEVQRMINPGLIGTRKLELVAFPNPVISTVTIRSKTFLNNTDFVTISIYNTTGVQLKSVNSNSQSLNAGVKIDMSTLATGVYIVKVLSPLATAEFKLIKTD